MLKSITIDGIDRLGKSSLISGLLNKLGAFQVIHYSKPLLLDCYKSIAKDYLKINSEASIKKEALKLYQAESFLNMMSMLSSRVPFLMDRSHLGEMVYSKRYRGYDGSYIYELEEACIKKKANFDTSTLQVLLYTSNFDILEDDGESFDFSKKEEEQKDFLIAIKRSNIKNKLIIDVHDGKGNFLPKEEILDRVVRVFTSN